MSSLVQDVASYERWPSKHCKVVKEDLEFKHERMRESAFVFLRATYFRWARIIEKVCPTLADAPKVLCVGDTHVENFGTWRDGDARHVWGVNDFDEAAVMPYAFDLARLLVSARLSPHFSLDLEVASDALLKGYNSGLEVPTPVLLDHGAQWFQTLVRHLDDGAKDFWVEVMGYPDADPPSRVRKALMRTLPDGAVVHRFATRRKGGGGLGRPRYVAVAEWNGGPLLREAKASVPSAWTWAHSKAGRSRFLDVAGGRYRSPDPSLKSDEGYMLRRVSPDSRKLDLKDVAKRGLGTVLIEAMGRDIGSIHAVHRRASLVARDLVARAPGWLAEAAAAAQRAVEMDFATWVGIGDVRK